MDDDEDNEEYSEGSEALELLNEIVDEQDYTFEMWQKTDEYKTMIDIVGDLGHNVMIMETAFNAGKRVSRKG